MSLLKKMIQYPARTLPAPFKVSESGNSGMIRSE